MSEENSSYTVVTNESWGSRLGGSIKGIITGLVLFALSFVVLFKNEGCAVRQARALEEGKSACVHIENDSVDMNNEGKLVHVSGKADTQERVNDSVSGIDEIAFSLERKVEIYQWVEETKTRKEKKLGGGEETITTYTYKRAWVSRPVDSSDFKDPRAHTRNMNVGSLPVNSEKLYCSTGTLGAFRLSEELIKRIGNAQDYVFAKDHKLPEETQKLGGIISGRYLILPYIDEKQQLATAVVEGTQPTAQTVTQVAGQMNAQTAGEVAGQVAGQAVAQAMQTSTPVRRANATPEIGDVRISYRIVRPHDFSIVGVQQGDTFVAHVATNGEKNLLTADSIQSANEMYQSAEEANAIKLWLLRLLGFAMMYLGLRSVLRPLEVLGDVVPFIGSIIGVGASIVSFMIAAPLSLLTIAIAWIFYRPVVGIILLVAALGIGFMVFKKAQAKKAASAAAA